MISLVAAAVMSTAPDWDQDSSRWFVSTRLDAGLMARAAIHAGYGRPFWLWAGFQSTATITYDFFSIASGLRLSLPMVEFTAEYRRTESFRRGALPGQSAYTSGDLGRTERQGYDAVDLDLWTVLPFPYGFVFAEGLGTWMADDETRYEELLRVIGQGWCGAVRGGVGARLGERGWMRFGAMTEAAWSERNKDPTVRVGPSVQLVFGRHVDVVIAALWQVAGVDTLHFLDGMTGALALRWRAASGDEAPLGFP